MSKAEGRANEVSKSNDNSDSDLSDDEINIYLSSIDKRNRTAQSSVEVETEPIQKIKWTYKKKESKIKLVDLSGGEANDNHFKLFEQYRSELENMKTEISTLKNEKKTTNSEPRTKTDHSVQEPRNKTDNEMRRELVKLRFT